MVIEQGIARVIGFNEVKNKKSLQKQININPFQSRIELHRALFHVTLFLQGKEEAKCMQFVLLKFYLWHLNSSIR